jgi:siroheme decarboxylase
MLRKKEKDVLKYFSSHPLELTTEPFAKAARSLSVDQNELIDILRRLQQRGFIKNLRGVLNHRNAGYKSNALIAWRIDAKPNLRKDNLIKDVFVNDDRISHCYERKPNKRFNYNVYTMMHGRTDQEINRFAQKTARRLKVNYEILFTDQELKKAPLSLGEILCWH